MRGAVMGGLIYEGLAADLEEAEKLAASGKITFDSCHHHNTVGPMAGVVTYPCLCGTLSIRRLAMMLTAR